MGDRLGTPGAVGFLLRGYNYYKSAKRITSDAPCFLAVFCIWVYVRNVSVIYTPVVFTETFHRTHRVVRLKCVTYYSV